jgi:hypothetical protein
MPNLYKRTLGKRKYHDFSKEDLDELAITLEGVPPQNIINYDETCFTDDPGRKVVSCSSAVM